MLHLGKQLLFDLQCGVNAGNDGLLVKIGIGNGGKQVQRDQMVYRRSHLLPLGPKLGRHSGDPLCHIDQQILHGSYIRFFTADARLRTARAAGGFLTLIAKHLIFHNNSSQFHPCIGFLKNCVFLDFLDTV